MTGYLARLAARAAGSRPVAMPRSPDSAGDEFSPETAAEVIAQAVTPMPPAEHTELRQATASGPGDAAAERANRPLPTRHHAAATSGDRRNVQDPVSQGRSAADTSSPVVARRATPDRAGAAAPIEQPATAVAARAPSAAGAPVAARPARAQLFATGPQPPATPAVPAPSTTETVHVTIGRVDVRTSVAPSPSPAPTPRPQAEPTVLSLHDYLRGERVP